MANHRHRLVLPALGLTAFAVVPILLYRYLGSPFAPALVRHPFGHLPPSAYLDLLKLVPYLIWAYLTVGLLAQAAQVAFGLVPRRVPIIGLSQDIARKVFLLVASAQTDPAVASRESILRGAVPAPLNHSLPERERALVGLRTTGRTPNDLLRHRRLPDSAIPPHYRRDPTRLWWADSVVRYLAAANPSRSFEVTQAKVAADVLVWVRGDKLVIPPPLSFLENVSTCVACTRTTDVAREIASTSAFETTALAPLVPLGLDDSGVLVLAPHLGEQVVDPFPLEVIAQYLALVPWLDQLWIATLGPWTRGAVAPAHQHCDDQDELIQRLPTTDRHVVVLADQPAYPLGPLQGLHWVGPTFDQSWRLVRSDAMKSEVRHK